MPSPFTQSLDGGVSRRRFLGSLTSVAAAGFFSGAGTSTRGAASSVERPVFATIGLRNQGWTITDKSFAYADFAALCDVDATILGAAVEKAADRQRHAPTAFRDYREILDRDDIDAVMIATPDHWHTKIAIEAMHAGKDVYCEKPLTVTVAEGKLIEEAVEKTGRVFQVGTMQRTECSQRFLTAIALVRAGRIGTVTKVTCGINGMTTSPPLPAVEPPEGLDWNAWLGPAPQVPYRALPKLREGYGGGVPLYSNCHYAFRNWFAYSSGKMGDWGAHHVDIACWALGAEATGPARVTPLEYELGVAYEDGDPLVHDRYNVPTRFRVSAAMPNEVELVITSEGDNGILFEGTAGRFFVNRGKLTGRPIHDLEREPLPDGAVEAVYGGPVPANHTVNFIEAMRSRTQPVSDVWSHNRALEICHLGNIAMRLGREVKWDPIAREILGDARASSMLVREYRTGFKIDV